MKRSKTEIDILWNLLPVEARSMVDYRDASDILDDFINKISIINENIQKKNKYKYDIDSLNTYGFQFPIYNKIRPEKGKKIRYQSNIQTSYGFRSILFRKKHFPAIKFFKQSGCINPAALFISWLFDCSQIKINVFLSLIANPELLFRFNIETIQDAKIVTYKERYNESVEGEWVSPDGKHLFSSGPSSPYDRQVFVPRYYEERTVEKVQRKGRKRITFTNWLTYLLQDQHIRSFIDSSKIPGVYKFYFKLRSEILDYYRRNNYIMTLALEAIDPNLRYEAVKKVEDDQTLLNIIEKSSDRSVRHLAAEGVKNDSTLFEIIMTFNEPDNNKRLISRISNQDILLDIVKESKHRDLRLQAFNRISKKEVIFRAAQEAPDIKIRLQSVLLLDSEEDLYQIVSNEGSKFSKTTSIQKTALCGIKNKDMLFRIARSSSDGLIGMEAVRRVIDIMDTSILYDLYKDAQSVHVRAILSRKLFDQDGLKRLIRSSNEIELISSAISVLNDQSFLIDVAMNSPDTRIRKTAISRIHDINTLKEMYEKESHIDVRDRIVQQINYVENRFIVSQVQSINSNNKVVDLAMNSPDIRVRMAAIEIIEDDDILSQIVRNENNVSVRFRAIRNIKDPHLLIELAKRYHSYYGMFKKIEDEEALINIVRMNRGRIFDESMRVISDQRILVEFVHAIKDNEVRRNVVKKIEDVSFLEEFFKLEQDNFVFSVIAQKIMCLRNNVPFSA